MITHQPYPSDVSDAEWEFVVPYLCLLARGRRPARPQPPRCLRRPALARPHRLPRGATCPRTSRPGRWSTSRPAAGWPPAASRPSSTTSAPSSASPPAGTPSRRPPSSTAARCSRPPRAAAGPATTGTSGARARRSTWRWTRSGTCWPCTSPRPNEQERDQVAVLAEAVQEVTGESVELAYVDQGYTGDDRRRPTRPATGSTWRS